MRLTQAAFYSFLTTCYGGCFYFAFGVFTTVLQAQDLGKFLLDFVVSMLACFALLSFVFYEILGAFEEINKPRVRQDEATSHTSRDETEKS